ncbi:MAG: quinol:electron acceptor oxidoreductase subunit ActD [Candidatus Kapabacteria bacterium]|nr:quinol:electron acceptor oxidoreductase subunit ActD [Candidatus Kapabacteria bacterium]
MENKILHSVSAIFNTPDEIIYAAKEIVKAGYKKFDIHTPYPIHGMDDAMKVTRSPLGYFAFALGVTGAALALLLMWGTMVVSYPNNIGGKPAFALPAFIPVTFEVTVLLASVATVTSMIIIFFRFPNNSHPLHDTKYMKRVSSDKYGAVIESDDPKFDFEGVKAFLTKIGSSTVEPIYYDNDELNVKHTLFDPKFLIGLAVLAVVVSSVTYFALNKMMFMQPFNWMMYQQKLSAQSPTTFFKDGFSMREPVAGTVAKNHIPYAYTDSAALAEKFMVNPLEINEANLSIGKAKYNTYCSPCHDYQGTGIARLNGQFPNPPSLHTDRVRNWKDGQIFHIITVGQNTMPSYASQLNDTERWQVITYLRALQRAMNATEEDVK